MGEGGVRLDIHGIIQIFLNRNHKAHSLPFFPGEVMVSEEELEKLKAESMTPEQWELTIIVSVCLLTALLAGFTVIAMSGDIEWTVHHTSQYGDWYEDKVIHFGWLLQGFLGFSTMGFFLLSIYLLMVRATEKGNLS